MRFLIVLGLSLGLSALIAGASPAIADTKLPKAPDTIVLTGTITGKDHQTYKELPFQVPAGIGRITVSFRYGGRDLKTTIDLGLYDPHGFRGWSGGNKSSFTIAKTDATPSYLPGPLPQGTWKLLLGIPNIRANVTAEYEARITLSASAGDLASLDDQPIRPDAGWYRGDFHAHTGHSDGVCTSIGAKRVPCPVFLTLEAAQAAGLDFIAISDHNTVSTFNSLRELQPYFDTLLVLPAREITTFFGHINAFGFTSPVDFQLGSSRLPNLGALQDQVVANHGLMSINHPALPSGEACMGCGWTVKQTDFRRIQAVEVVNGGAVQYTGSAEGALSQIPFWEDLLNQGYKITAIGGSDNHDAKIQDQQAGPPPIGRPTTLVYAQNLSQSAILDGVRSGRVTVDLEGIKGRRVDLRVSSDGAQTEMGGRLKLPAGGHARFEIHGVGFEGCQIEFVTGPQNTAPRLASQYFEQADDKKVSEVIGAGTSFWLRVNIRDRAGRLIALTNPIYVD